MSLEKVKSRKEIATLVQALKAANKKVGFTSGVFDLLHSGHVEYLQKAKDECDVLIVGLNTDRSVRKNKGELRPIIKQEDRTFVIAALSVVDYVFLFDEDNNNRNIELLKPDLYIKASDYGEGQKKLSSAPIVEGYGGRVVLIPLKSGRSSSKIISDILDVNSASSITADPLPLTYDLAPAAFIDRDGTINKEVEYLCDPDKFEIIPNALEGIKKLQDIGYRIVIVTNQPGIGLGYYDKSDLFKVNGRFLKAASAAGITVHKIYFCPHSKSDGCVCRKPEPGMLLRAKDELNIDLGKSVIIGDTTSDIAAGKKAGCKTVLVRSGKGGRDGLNDVVPDIVVDDILAAAEYIHDHISDH